MSMGQSTDEILQEVLDKMDEKNSKIKHHFKPCPDCGYLPDPYPRFNRNHEELWTADHYKVIYNGVSAECPVCGWGTPKLTNVAECCKYWNEHELTPPVEEPVVTIEDQPVYHGPYSIKTANMEDKEN